MTGRCAVRECLARDGIDLGLALRDERRERLDRCMASASRWDALQHRERWALARVLPVALCKSRGCRNNVINFLDRIPNFRSHKGGSAATVLQPASC